MGPLCHSPQCSENIREEAKIMLQKEEGIGMMGVHDMVDALLNLQQLPSPVKST